MKLKIEINLDNDAFQPDYTPEVQRILEHLIVMLDPYMLKDHAYIMRDSNGNNVGEAKLEE